jgi:UDP-N-acetylglucosamine diphosphorylase/glucosamine-1-phosphate N-acetyltransferase
MNLYLFDDRKADAWRPFALTRPIGELRFGALTLRERIERWAEIRATGALTRPWLTDFSETGAPPAHARDSLSESAPTLLVSSRFVPHDERSPIPLEVAGETTLLLCRDEVAGCLVPAGAELPDEAWMLDPGPLPGASTAEVPGRMLESVWQLVEFGPERLARDLARMGKGIAHADLPAGVYRMGTGPVVLSDGVVIEPGVVFDTSEGGVALGTGTVVRAGARLQGPIATGPDCRLLGGAYSGVSAGARSYLRGEVEASTTLGFVNKAHDGFLGHAVVGRWVNLGALTTNSDLKSTYGAVSLGGPDGPVATGLQKLGCLIGDHAKTAIGTLLTTGTVVGAGASIFGREAPERWAAPFSWGTGGSACSYDLERFLTTAATVLERRGVEPTEQVRSWLSACWQQAGKDAGVL